MPPRKSNLSIVSGPADEGTRDPNAASSPATAKEKKEKDDLAIEVRTNLNDTTEWGGNLTLGRRI